MTSRLPLGDGALWTPGVSELKRREGLGLLGWTQPLHPKLEELARPGLAERDRRGGGKNTLFGAPVPPWYR